MNQEYKRLLVVGITYNKVERGLYALILQELGGTRRLPIIIGMSEAQSIECKLQEIITPRPLTHDLMVNIMRAFGLGLDKVVVKQLDGGIFATDLYLTDGQREVIVDSRSSDGISIALRMGVPIYTTGELLDKVALTRPRRDADTTKEIDSEAAKNVIDKPDDVALESLTVEELQALMDSCVENEEYEAAARIKTVLDRKKQK